MMEIKADSKTQLLCRPREGDSVHVPRHPATQAIDCQCCLLRHAFFWLGSSANQGWPCARDQMTEKERGRADEHLLGVQQGDPNRLFSFLLFCLLLGQEVEKWPANRDEMAVV